MNIKRPPFRILITAGPTREPIDAVRFISNYSTGKMGYQIAEEAKKRGYKTTLISGPTALIPPQNVKFLLATTAQEMKGKIEKCFPYIDCLVMAAAISDFRAKRHSFKKIKRQTGLRLELKKNPDILAQLGKRKGKRILVGFALETENLIENARAKLTGKNLDLIVVTQIKKNFSPFGEKRISGIILNREGRREGLLRISKERLAKILLDKVERLWHSA